MADGRDNPVLDGRLDRGVTAEAAAVGQQKACRPEHPLDDLPIPNAPLVQIMCMICGGVRIKV